MKVTTETVSKLIITEIPSQDPISVYLEDMGPGRGKATITCCSDSWTSGWEAIGNEYDIRKFLLACDNDYLIRKFSCGIKRTIDDYDHIADEAKKSIIERRKHDEITKEKARNLYDNAELLASCDCRERLGEHESDLCEYFGDEWYDCLPQELNPKYEYLNKIITIIKAALSGGEQ